MFGQVIGEQLGSRVDVFAAEDARYRLIGSAGNRLAFVGLLPLGKESGVPGSVVAGMEGAAFVFLDRGDLADGLFEFFLEA